jgi:hypothetical protein
LSASSGVDGGLLSATSSPEPHPMRSVPRVIAKTSRIPGALSF